MCQRFQILELRLVKNLNQDISSAFRAERLASGEHRLQASNCTAHNIWIVLIVIYDLKKKNSQGLVLGHHDLRALLGGQKELDYRQAMKSQTPVFDLLPHIGENLDKVPLAIF